MQCDEATAVGLRDTLWRLLFEGPESKRMGKPLKTQLGLALAALAVQCNEGLWADPVGMASDALQASTEEDVACRLIEFLTFIPEQLANRLIPLPRAFYGSQRERLMGGGRVLAVLEGQLAFESRRRAVLAALHSWVKYADASAGGSALSSPSLLQTAFTFLHLGLETEDGGLLEGAAELACELFYQVHRLEEAEPPEWIGTLIAGLQSLWPRMEAILRADEDDDDEEGEDVLRRVGMVYAESGEAFLAHLMARDGLGLVVEVLLRVVERKASSLALVQLTFPFWEVLSARVADGGDALLEAFTPVFGRLFRATVTLHLPYPSDGVMAAMSGEAVDRFRDFRHTLGDALKDCVRAMGSTEALLLLLGLLQANKGDWQGLEAVLFGMRTVSSAVDRRESEALPILYPAILALQPGHPKILYGVLLNIGCYADWLRYHPEHLPPTLQYLAHGFQAPEATAAAAQALNYLAEACGRLLVPFLPTLLLPLYTGSMQASACSARDKLLMTEALGRVFACLPLGDLARQLEAVLDPWVNGQLLPGLAAKDQPRVAQALDHYAVLVETITEPADETTRLGDTHPALQCFVALWDGVLLTQLPGSLADRAAAEALTTLLKAAIAHYGPSLPHEWDLALLRLIQSLLPASPALDNSSLLLAARSFLISTSGERRARVWPQVSAALLLAAQMLLQRGSTRQNEDAIGDYFTALTAAIDYCPEALAAEQLLHLSLALGQSVIRERPAAPSDLLPVLVFLQHALQVLPPQATRLLLDPLTACIYGLLEGALLAYPPALIADIPAVLVRFARLPGAASLPAILASLLPGDIFLERERQAWSQQFAEALAASARPSREIKELLRSMAQACKRRLH
jgi:hypothetical protein